MGVRTREMTLAARRNEVDPEPYTGLALAAGNGPPLGPGTPADLRYVLCPNLELRIDSRVLRAMEREHFDLKVLYTELVRNGMHASVGNEDQGSVPGKPL
jgi:hypothetical protein